MGEPSLSSRSMEAGPDSGVRVPFEHIARHSGRIEDTLRKFKVPARDRPDVKQDILLSAWRSVQAGGFRPSPHLKVKRALSRWMFAVTWHQIIHYRERQRRWDMASASPEAPAVVRPAPSLLYQVEARLMLRALDRLKPALRDVVVGSALGFTAEEMAAELGQNPVTIQHRVERGRVQLRAILRPRDAPTPLAIRSMLASVRSHRGRTLTHDVAAPPDRATRGRR
ncbi:sigma-70 family RNA polymerase sigma factor [Sorangium sp. So ce1151]|uniref:sigma-70 family RNA polymerase sigma factor n=1 Tax=Sorangium sp. So ce1151 TaxID=3133332 RepID=UPI003F5FED15